MYFLIVATTYFIILEKYEKSTIFDKIVKIFCLYRVHLNNRMVHWQTEIKTIKKYTF